MKIFFYGLIILLCAGLSNAERLCPSGNVVVDRDARPDFTPGDNGQVKRLPPGLMLDTVEVLLNRGFETGDLSPWYTDAWVVVNQEPHTGNYCALAIACFYLQQDITPTLADSIVSVTFWARQPEYMFQRVDFLVRDDTAYYGFFGEQADWQQYDATPYLPLGKWVIALRFWGYSLGSSQHDLTYIDDISLRKLRSTIKIEEGHASNRWPDLYVSPNPVRDRAVIEWTGLKNENPAFAIYDLRGAVVERGLLMNGKYVWSTRGLVSGAYFIRIDRGNGITATKEVLIVK